MKWPVLYFTPTISENLKQELTQIALDHRGSVVNHVSEASHIIDWDEEVDGTLPQQLEEEFCRPVEIRPHEGDGTALVHWWYHPDSYDEWIPSQEVEGNVLPDDPVELRPRVWKLSCRYIRDVLIFNEWGNELDYEIEEGDDDSPLENHTGRKRKGRKSDESRLKKRVDTLIVEAVTATDKMLQNLPPPTSNPNSAVTIVNINGPVQYEYEVKSENLNVPSESKKRSAEASNPDSPSQTLKKRLFMESHVISDTDTKCEYPVWFDRNMISSVERRYLPEVLHCDYFGSNSIDIDPHCCQKYLTIRNYIMDLYNQNPFVYLSATECRQKISGDVSIIIRIHEFLDVFGLINFSSKIKPHSRPPKSGSFYSSFPSQSEIISHCESISSYGKNSQIQSLQCNGHTNHWTPEMDQELLSSIVSQQAADVDIDWNTIAATLNQYNPSITAKECFMHFVQMSLLESSLPSSSQNMTQVESCTTGLLPSTSCELNTASSHLYTEGSGRNSWGVSRKIRSVAALVVSECSSKLDYNQAQEAISAVNEVYRVTSHHLSL